MPYSFILNHYFGDEPYALSEGASGYNNTTRYIDSRGERFVLRIYETHRDAAKIRFEHAVLMKLAELDLPFQSPRPVVDRDGASFLRLEDGRFACLFRYMEGVRPNSRERGVAKAVGDTVGRLSRALSEIELEQAPEYPPYYEMDLAHPSCGPDTIRRFCSQPPAEFADRGVQLQEVLAELERFRTFLPELRRLPRQLVHGDINDSNLLAAFGNPERIRAVLDFEFCTNDLRAMEPAVVLSGMLEGEGSRETIPAFLAGFSAVVRLTKPEAEAIPLLIRLRKLDVFVHFLGRYLDGVDGPAVLREQIEDAAQGLTELRRMEDRLRNWCRALSD